MSLIASAAVFAQLLLAFGVTEVEVGDTLDKLLESRRRLRSGHFVVTGTFGRQQDRALLECWFSGSRWMFDRQTERSRHRVLVTDEFCYVKADDSDVLLVDEDAAMKYAKWFDIRVVGLAGAVTMTGKRMNVEELTAIYRNGRTPFRMEETANGKVRLVRGPFPNSEIKQIITIDTKNGFVPLESRLFHPQGNQLLEVSWEVASGCWVPKRIVERHGSETVMELEFEWKSVNSDVTKGLDQRRVFPGGTRFLKDIGGKTEMVSRPVENWWSEAKAK